MGQVNLAPTHARILLALGADHAAALQEPLEQAGHQIVTGDACDEESPAPDLVLAELAQVEEWAGRQTSVLAIAAGTTATPAGCVGVLSWPLDHTALQVVAALAVRLRQAEQRAQELEQVVGGMRDGSAIVGRSPVMRRLAEALRRAADNDATLLIEGPAGSGKSLAARVVHCKSRRGTRPAVVVECDGVDGDGLQEVLAGAAGTTVLLENVERLPAAAQSVLVRFLKERPRPGTERERPRLIATTSAHLPELVAKGSFREDVYYRLNAFPLRMPALRERVEDIGLLANAFLQGAVPPGTPPAAGFTAAALILLESMPWPGNVGQLEGVIRRAHVLASGGPVDRAHLLGPTTGLAPAAEPKVTVETASDDDEVSEEQIRPFEEEEQILLGRALRATKGNVRRAAQLLGIGRATLYRKIQQYRLRLN